GRHADRDPPRARAGDPAAALAVRLPAGGRGAAAPLLRPAAAPRRRLEDRPRPELARSAGMGDGARHDRPAGAAGARAPATVAALLPGPRAADLAARRRVRLLGLTAVPDPRPGDGHAAAGGAGRARLAVPAGTPGGAGGVRARADRAGARVPLPAAEPARGWRPGGVRAREGRHRRVPPPRRGAGRGRRAGAGPAERGGAGPDRPAHLDRP